MKKIAVIGCGWLGMPLAEKLLKDGYDVIGFARRPEVLDKLQSIHIPVISRPFSFEGIDIVISTITPPKTAADEEIHHEIALAAKAADVAQMIYTSSISVYPDEAREVQEPDAIEDHPIRLLEKMYAQTFPSSTILRLGGLYGGERHPAKYLSGRSDLPKPLAPINLVSREKVIFTIEKVIQKEVIGDIINVVDAEHPTRKDYYTAICEQLGIAPPLFSADESLGKIVSSKKWNQYIEG